MSHPTRRPVADSVDGLVGIVGGFHENGEAVRDHAGRVVAFTDPAMCQTVAAVLVGAGHPPLLAPVPLPDTPGCA